MNNTPATLTAQSALATVLANHGCMSEEESKAIAVDFPNLIVGVKMGCSMRFLAPIGGVHEEIAYRVSRNPADEYVREMFFPCDVYDTLRATLGLSKDN